MDIIGCTFTSKLAKKRTSNKCMTEKLTKGYENNYKKEGKIILIRKTWERNIFMGKCLNRTLEGNII